jgi:uncharacterized protein (TIGR02246 family)
MMNYFKTTGFILIVMHVIIGCGTPQKVDNTTAARAAITAANELWMAAFDKGDAAGIAANYTEDTQVMPPNSEIVRGRAAVQSVFQGFIDAGLKVKLETVEVEGQGDIAFEVGMADVIGPDGQMLDKGKYIVIWKMVGSEWKMYRDIWNSNMPLPQPE